MNRYAPPAFYLHCAVALSVFTPLVALPLRDGSTVVFYLFVALALAALLRHGLQRPAWRAGAFPAEMALALLAPLASLLLTALSVRELEGAEFEKALRFALSLPLLWLLGFAPVRWLRHAQWGIMGGACAGGAIILWGALSGAGRSLVSIGANYNAVTVSNLTLLFGLMSLLTLPWALSPWPRAERAAKIGACLFGVTAMLVSETRSSWMLMPVFLLILLAGCTHLRPRQRLALALAGAVALAVVGLLLYAEHPRFLKAAEEFRQFSSGGDRDTSVGIRLQLWRAALLVFADHPWLGAGPWNFRQALGEFAGQGLVTPFVAANFGEPHNDFLEAMAGCGVVGMLSMLALYGLPALWFARRLRSPDRGVRAAARLGLLLCLGYAVFSLTELMFRNMRSVPIYSGMLVILASLAREPAQPDGNGS